MPLPIFLIGAVSATAKIAGVVAIGSGISGGVKMKKANDTIKDAQQRNEAAQEKLKKHTEQTNEVMDLLGKEELEIVGSFEIFSDYWEKIKNKPNIHEIELQDIKLPPFDFKKLKEVSAAASVAKGALGGAAVGAAGRFAATGVGTLTAGGIGLGTSVLGGAAGLLVSGIIFNITGSKMSDKADQAWRQMKDNEEKVNEACLFLIRLSDISKKYYDSLLKVKKVYYKKLDRLKELIDGGHNDWKAYSQNDLASLRNLTLLVQLLYNMCEVKIIVDDGKKINSKEIKAYISQSNELLDEINGEKV